MSATLGQNQRCDRLRITVLAPDLSGGGVTRVYLLARVLQTLGHCVTVLGVKSGSEIYPAPPSGLEVRSFPTDRTPLWRTVGQLLQRLDADLVYAVKPRLTSFGVALLQRLGKRRPVVLDIDDWELSWLGGDTQPYRPTLRQLIRDALRSHGALRQADHRWYLEGMERLVGRADAVTVDTQFLQQRFGGTYLPNGKDTQLFNPAHFDPEVSRRKYGLSGYRVLMFPGTARPHKGLEDLCIALEQLQQPDLRLVLVGGRRPDRYQEDLVARWGHWIIELPRMPVEQMPEVVAAADLVVVPQRDTAIARAQFPLKLTDGMAMAKPILTTRVGDIPQIVGATAYLVEPGQPSQLAGAIQQILGNPGEAQERGRLARLRCLQHYSLEAMAAILSPLLGRWLAVV